MVRNNQATACDVDSAYFHLANCDYFFILGRTSDETTNDKVRKESEKHGDILMEDFSDSYNNLTVKSLHMIKFFLQAEQFTHLVKVES